ncbi:MAG: tetratricopeptide repeat protein [Thermoanaerobaculales bacterium]
MEEQEISREAMREMVQDAVTWTREEKYVDAIDVFERYLSPLSEGNLEDKRLAAATFSYYGVCVAMVKRKYADAVKYCNISVRSHVMDAEHRVNLAQVYLERDDRRKAVENLEAGLRMQPFNKRISQIFEELGRRSRPPITFLSRRNPINIWLGKFRNPKTD